jgi:hypothetical protein
MTRKSHGCQLNEKIFHILAAFQFNTSNFKESFMRKTYASSFLFSSLIVIFFSGVVMAAEVNLATTDNGAVIYSSEYKRFYDSGKLFDNKEKTWYMSLSGSQPRSITIDWRKYVEFSKVKIVFKEAFTGKIHLESYEKDSYVTIPDSEINSQAQTEVTHTFAFQRSERIRFVFSSKKALKITQIAVLGKSKPSYESNWSGKWIWGDKKERTVTFRKTVSVDKLKGLTGAYCQVAADDVVYLKINNKDVGSGTFRAPGQFDIREFLKAGENVFEASVVDGGGAFGFIGEILFCYGEKTKLIVTDRTWKVVKGTSTERAQVVHNTPPDCPWGYIEHVNFFSQKTEVIIEKLELPAEVKPGSTLKGSLHLKATADIADPLHFQFKLAGTASSRSDLRVGQCEVSAKLSSGQVTKVPFTMEIGLFAPDGEVPLTLQVSGKRTPTIRYQGNKSELGGLFQVGTVKVNRFEQAVTARTEFPEIEIKKNGDAPALYVDGKAVPLVVLTNFNIGYRTMHEYSKTGVEIYRILALGNVVTSPDKQDALLKGMFLALEAEVDKILRYNPRALILLSTMMRTTPDWVKAYPDEVIVHGDGTRATSHHSPASLQWRKDAAYVVEKLNKYVNSRPWGKNVIGYTFLDGGGGEFHKYGKTMGLVEREKGFAGDFSPAAINSFRKWLKNKYKTNEALQHAWNSPVITFDNAQVDSEMLMEESKNGFFYNPSSC